MNNFNLLPAGNSAFRVNLISFNGLIADGQYAVHCIGMKRNFQVELIQHEIEIEINSLNFATFDENNFQLCFANTFVFSVGRIRYSLY
jgi:hypothetical protein